MAQNQQFPAIPVDTTGAIFGGNGEPMPRVDFETGEIRTDEENRTLYEVPVIMLRTGERAGTAITVTVAGEPPAGIGFLTPLHIAGLVARMWMMPGKDGNTRAGMSYRAETITPATGTTTKAVA